MFKKLKTLALLPVMCLAACSGTDSYYGKYAFRLGKAGEAETRIGLEVTLNEKVIEGKGRELIFKLEAGEMSILDILKLFLDVDEEGNVYGYYNISNSTSNADGNLVKIGVNTTEEISKIIPSEIVEKVIQHVLTAHVNKKALTIQVPVSIDDITMQLTWYGLFIGKNIDSSTGQMKSSLFNLRDYTITGDLPGEYGKDDPSHIEKRYGTHPVISKDEQGSIKINNVDDFNRTFAKQFSNTYLVQKDTESGKCNFAPITYDYTKDKADCETFIVENGVEIGSGGATFTIVRNGENQLGQKYKDIENVKVEIDPTNRKITYLTIPGEEEPVSGKDISKYVAEPFVFRDYHALKIGLLKD